jgi:hypothetical protein
MRATLARGDTLDQEVRLLREGIARLDPVEVTARPERPLPMGRDAFEVRRRLGFGKFIDSAEMRRADGRRLSEVLRRTGVRMVNFKIRHHIEIRAEPGQIIGLLGDGDPGWSDDLPLRTRP